MVRSKFDTLKVVVFSATVSTTGAAFATGGAGGDSCEGLPNHSQLQSALQAALGGNGGLNFPMWGTIVNRDGEVCAVAKTSGDPWPGSRVISAQKANTANAFSSNNLALSTANLYSATQPGGSLFGLQESNPVDPRVAYRGKGRDFGTSKDPMVGLRIGGINVFGGGVALYNKGDGKTVLGGLGVSGDTACADHNIAWKVRVALGFNRVPSGLAPGGTDNIIYDVNSNGASAGGFGHPKCNESSVAPANNVTQ